MGYEQQVIQNSKAIQDIYDNAKKISQLPVLPSGLSLDDMIGCELDSTNEVVQIKVTDLISFFTSLLNSQKETFTAVDDQTDFTLTTTPNNVDVIIDRVIQEEGTDYTLTNNVVTFTEIVEDNSIVTVRKF